MQRFDPVDELFQDVRVLHAETDQGCQRKKRRIGWPGIRIIRRLPVISAASSRRLFASRDQKYPSSVSNRISGSGSSLSGLSRYRFTHSRRLTCMLWGIAIPGGIVPGLTFTENFSDKLALCRREDMLQSRQIFIQNGGVRHGIHFAVQLETGCSRQAKYLHSSTQLSPVYHQFGAAGTMDTKTVKYLPFQNRLIL